MQSNGLTDAGGAEQIAPLSVTIREQSRECRGTDIDSCSACRCNGFNLCAGIKAKMELLGRLSPGVLQLMPITRTFPARRQICHARESSEFVTVICKGWAASVIALPDGRRQIHSFLFPGDVVLSTSPFNPVLGHTVEAITEVVSRHYKRGELEALICQNPDLFRRFMGMWSEAWSQTNQLTLSLGRRTAHERIAALILSLADALTVRGIMSGATMEFPLRLKHIADATGLTPVHVSRVQTDFQKAGLISINDRSVTILDRGELRRAAGPQ